MRTVLIILLIVLCNSVFNWLTNLPQDVGKDVPQGKLSSLSFAPYRDGQNPFEKKFPTAAQIDADLALLATKTHGIRTYASSEGNMPSIPELAQKHGLTMTQGAWLSGISKDNQQEVHSLIQAANTYPDVVKRVIVGNEVLLRKDLKIDQLINYIRTVKQAVKQPLSYADVWSIYMKYPELINEVDFVTIHILPYWEDEPISAQHAPAHIAEIYKQVREKVDSISPNKPILIGETGWPSAGRQRGLAVPSVVNEASFIRSLIHLAQKNGFDYNIVEAFNQSWKSELEGVVGARWGLFSADRTDVFPLTGEVHETPEWYLGLFASTGLFLLVALCFWQQIRTLAALHIAVLSVFLVFIQLLSSLLVHEANWLWLIAFNEWQPLFREAQRYYALSVIMLSTLMAGLLLQRAYNLLANRSTVRIGEWLYVLYILFAWFALYKTYGLALHGRYLSFPYPATAIPVIGITYLMLVRYLTTDRRFSLRTITLDDLIGNSDENLQQDKLLGYTLLVMSLALLVGEIYAFTQGGDFVLAYSGLAQRIWQAFILTISNAQLLLWLLSLIILAVPLIANGYRKTEAQY